MPRRSSSRSSYGSRGSSFSRQPRSQPQPQKTVPQQTFTQQPPVQRSGGMMSGIGSTVMTGMAFGAGSEVAHQAVRGIMGSGSGSGSHGNNSPQETNNQQVGQQEYNQQPQQYQQQNPCMSYNQKFVECLKENEKDISDCQNFLNDLKSCEKHYNP